VCVPTIEEKEMNMGASKTDGIHDIVRREAMCEGARKLRDTYAITPNVPLYRKEFGFYCLEQWGKEGLSAEISIDEYFSFDQPGVSGFCGLGSCEPAYAPPFEVKLLEERGEQEIEQDYAGRKVLYFKGRRQGFMPEYLDHPVKDRKSWEENCKWRLNPHSPERYADLKERIEIVSQGAREGKIVSQGIIGGYMYLRSLMGPVDVMILLHEQPELIHECMEAWFHLADVLTAKHQEHLTLDEIRIDEDICYNKGLLISPDMIREFLFPYYQQLILNIKSRQIDRLRHLFLNVDTDGDANPIIPMYREIGLDVMAPFEVASGCDVVEIGRKFPWLVISGGIDKRVLAKGKKEIDGHVERILPAMRARGGYIPTCDHGVPEEVSLENYLHYRKRCVELGG